MNNINNNIKHENENTYALQINIPSNELFKTVTNFPHKKLIECYMKCCQFRPETGKTS